MFAPDRTSPDPQTLRALCAELASAADDSARCGPWRSGAFASLARHGALAGFIDRDAGGVGAAEPAILELLSAVAETCLTTALAVSQWAAACRIIAAGDPATRAAWLPPLARGDSRTTIGISQLTTSRQHLGSAALRAQRQGDGWRLEGLCPWVTGADAVDSIVTGAATADGQAFFIVPTDAPGVLIEPPLEMLSLTGSRTSVVRFAGVTPAAVIAPLQGSGPRTGGLATTALAIGAARASLAVIDREAVARPILEPVSRQFRAETDGLAARLAHAASSGIEPADRDRLRADANSLVLRAAQAALTACKGAGFIAGHPAERLVREAMFFLVWSCPQAVTHAVLCDLLKEGSG